MKIGKSFFFRLGKLKIIYIKGIFFGQEQSCPMCNLVISTKKKREIIVSK